jgi:hypothetical protein
MGFARMVHMQADYEAAWRDFRKRSIILWAAALGYVPGMAFISIAIVLPLSALTGIKPDNIVLPVAVCWLATIVITGFYRSLFRCPRCGKEFFWGSWFVNSFARKCMHCGLRKWARADQPNSS